jgi:hypothetical protein
LRRLPCTRVLRRRWRSERVRLHADNMLQPRRTVRARRQRVWRRARLRKLRPAQHLRGEWNAQSLRMQANHLPRAGRQLRDHQRWLRRHPELRPMHRHGNLRCRRSQPLRPRTLYSDDVHGARLQMRWNAALWQLHGSGDVRGRRNPEPMWLLAQNV